ncbi:ABC transporter ATP-binding protein [Streptomyces nitrosporeus]|uniref:ABC transporter ATP-binding protein n=1 Tax=Streptomyces nitrosporeus TaxID=28894 RepID=A0A5J6F7E2_9ACTN|nr:ABC-F family ATP-binding cassette domain-containing protein [Streptomyces nitrosporeus]QEU71767.1 ABC transporter ATP-binding protein [Streptomyces nitrosporeus]GGY94467.1 ABC transporter ATP-binding protein [Streptomyces nitrosporeus]
MEHTTRLPDPADVLSGSRGAAHLAAEGVSHALGDRPVLRDISLTVAADERIGLIGENGLGKSTLLRVLARDLTPERGSVLRAVTGRVGFLPQEPGFPAGWCVTDVLDRAHAELDALAARLSVLEEDMTHAEGPALDALLADYSRTQDLHSARGGWEREARTGEVLAVFGLGGLAPAHPVARLSSGQRARLALAELVLADPCALLLDEPTNHLDDRAADWLTDWLRRYRGPCVIASHDRALLTDAVTGIVDLDGPRGTVVRHGGGYRDYLAEQRAARARWERRYAQWRDETDRVRERLARASSADDGGGLKRDNEKMSYGRTGGRVQAGLAHRARSARLDLQRLLDRPVPRPPEPLRFRARTGDGGPGTAPRPAPQQAEAGPPLLEAAHIAFRDVLHDIGLTLRDGDLTVITGPNGAGKSTLLRILAGVLPAEHGDVTLGEGVRVGYLPQETVYEDGHRSLLEVYARRRALDQDTAYAELGRFGLFRRRDLAVPVDRLSTGQRRRLSIAELFAARPGLLLLDEPTNHLSLPLVEQLQEAIEEFTGPKVLVTHDRALRERYADHVVELADGVLRRPGRIRQPSAPR